MHSGMGDVPLPQNLEFSIEKKTKNSSNFFNVSNGCALPHIFLGMRPDNRDDLFSDTYTSMYARVVHTVGPGPKFGPLPDFFWALKV